MQCAWIPPTTLRPGVPKSSTRALCLAPRWCYATTPVTKEELVHLDGEVILIAKGGNFRVKLDNGHETLAKLAGKVRRHRIRVVLGDRVTVAVSPYDPARGFIVYRQR